ncbi:MAG: undecaprenyl-diphosphatase UppP [Candidatus Moranbacteria bacterium RIFOXYB1_FULL_43_19]|nr:MAG: undecaprenyl-diphosphatase UppP [Candidatus Moranbacteria bacterium RIFOXYB1_FULL_43_19]OGI28332.1 MAG: undecaprenyl-diphosphatase UppP [Candidatus Moranbacteria bacterium RIFOXYA1_FULL_44_7]OGI33703.1 MAG: undecaprenyl-diphosphatase UppP [Candidatus Moranbacteria bacterium RIFOXYC1_FULL_44_13]OGI37459.1 MAG: undecaprenyl-diphosphatase UppP [Candidatus Moranbacteria bacterium RIFOXYD1_FULL_44_12]
MTVFHSLILGIIQGASEFLPISSSAHLILAPWLFRFSDPGLSFDVALHFGTLIAVVLYFWKDWIEIFRLALFSKTKSWKSFPRLSLGIDSFKNEMLWLLVLATIPGILAGYFLENYAESSFRSPIPIAITLSLVGLVLYLVDRYHRHRKNLGKISWSDSLLVGLSQAAAIFPGVSRSGATITTGLFLGLNRESAARFSFLLSTPIILGAAAAELPHLLKNGLDIYLVLGMLSAAVSGYLAIKYLLKFVERTSYAIFFWYRLALALVIISVYFFRA